MSVIIFAAPSIGGKFEIRYISFHPQTYQTRIAASIPFEVVVDESKMSPLEKLSMEYQAKMAVSKTIPLMMLFFFLKIQIMSVYVHLID